MKTPKKDRSKPSPYRVHTGSNVERALDKIDIKVIRHNQATVRFDSRRSTKEYTYLNWRPWDDVS